MNYYVKAAQFLLADGCRQQGYLHIQNGYFGEIVEVFREGGLLLSIGLDIRFRLAYSTLIFTA